jgi:L-asparaginase
MPPRRPVCCLVATGGTIAMRLDAATGAAVPAVSGEELVRSVPGLDGVAEVRVRELFNIPSDHMDPPRWAALHGAVTEALAAQEVHGVIVSHGTDTLEETAWFLDLTVPAGKPVVLVGAQRNGSDPHFDGPRNLLHAARVCTSTEAAGKGTLVVMNNQVHAAREATKTHTSDVESFRSGDFGLLGTVDEDRVVFARQPLRRQHVALAPAPLPRVDIVPMYAGADGTLLRAAVQAGARGVVLQALGLGNVNAPLHEAVAEAVRAGVAVVVSTRVPRGRVRPAYGFAGGGMALKTAGACFADDLPPHKARILLMLALQSPQPAQRIQAMFDT